LRKLIDRIGENILENTKPCHTFDISELQTRLIIQKHFKLLRYLTKTQNVSKID